MAQVVDRFTVSLDTELLAAFDRHIAERGYENRSEAVRDLIRDLLLETRLRGTEHTIGFVTFLMDHTVRDAGAKVRRLLAEKKTGMRGVLNVPLDEMREAVVVGVEGEPGEITELSDGVRSLRGVSYVKALVMPTNEG